MCALCVRARTHITHIFVGVCVYFVYSLALEQDHIKFKLLLWRTLRAYLPRELVFIITDYARLTNMYPSTNSDAWD